jgi:hypothetical protein
MIRLPQPRVLNSAGKPILLNKAELYNSKLWQYEINRRFKNVLGYEVPITTLTTIVKKITTQKFYNVAPADYVPVRVGQGAFSSNLVTYRDFDLADDFATGIINTGQANARTANVNVGIDAVTVQIKNWNKAYGWSIFDLEMAAKSGNWDIVTAKEKARKKNWDLGIQQVAFLGLKNDSTCLGLLTQKGITMDTTTITKPISSMTTAELKTFTANVLTVYRTNNQRTAMPTHFILPESDFLGLASAASPDFPIRATADLLLETFKVMTGNKNFKLLPLSYADPVYNAGFINGSTGFHIYTLLNYEEESIRMDIPVNYTPTLANSLDNFNFQNAGYGQFTGVQAYRPLELYYFVY